MLAPSPLSKRKQHGFSLVELMVAVVIIGIIAAVALPSYQNHVMRTQRAAASACLTEVAQVMERVYVTNLRFDQNNGVATTLPNTTCQADIANRYTLALAAVTQRTFSLTATPQGAQSSDGLCGTLSINQAGVRTITGSGTAANCFR